MRYIPTKQGRTPRYQGTVDLQNGKSDSPELAELRKNIKQFNQEWSTTYYIKLHGRGHRFGIRCWNQSIPLPHATHADVYLYERRIF